MPGRRRSGESCANWLRGFAPHLRSLSGCRLVGTNLCKFMPKGESRLPRMTNKADLYHWPFLESTSQDNIPRRFSAMLSRNRIFSLYRLNRGRIGSIPSLHSYHSATAKFTIIGPKGTPTSYDTGIMVGESNESYIYTGLNLETLSGPRF